MDFKLDSFALGVFSSFVGCIVVMYFGCMH